MTSNGETAEEVTSSIGVNKESVKNVRKKRQRSAPSRKRSAENSPTGKQSSLGLWLFSLFNMLLLVALAGAGYWYWLQQQQTQADWQAQTQALKSQLSTAQQQLQQQQQNMVVAQQKTATELQNAIKNNQSRITELGGRRPGDWLLAEADYLVRMAGRKLWLEQDLATAEGLLEAADVRLAELRDTSLLPVRQVLRADIQALAQLQSGLQEDLALTLHGLIVQVDRLDMQQVSLARAIEEPDYAVSESLADWRENLAKVWRSIADDFITYRRRDSDTQPLLTQEQQWLVLEGIRYQIRVAQQAVFEHNSELYQQSLQYAMRLVNQYASMEEQVNQGFAQQLQVLADKDIAIHYPEQFNVAPLLQDALATRVSQPFVNQSTSEQREAAL